MPIHFSIGFSLTDNPKKPLICAVAVYVTEVNVTAIWPTDAGPC